MLVLSRKVGERVVIGSGIVVVVKRVSGQRVTFGIEAPTDVKIIRGELEVFDKSHEVEKPRLLDRPMPVSAAVAPFIPAADAASAVPVKPR